ncbi:MAG: NADH pyrophosphatase [Candidatus Margulisbacteria bacterium GWF2_35_9]|nr:MAG: NADH pyrophosphatase [Candidatus Margulisbacteria bacterium GWF2_35_9]
MIQQISPHDFSNQYVPNRHIEDGDYVIYYKENSILLKANGDDFALSQKKDLGEFLNQTASVFLFALNNIPCFLILDQLVLDESQFIYKDLSFFRTARQREIAWISILGFQLKNWYAQNQFCGKCGTRTQQKSDERALICPNCNTIVFPKISPAIIVAIISNNKLLLARNASFPASWYSLIAGYADVGESLEETVIREVKEEVGLDVKNIRYYRSQPWPISSSMMIGFIAEADENQPIVIDNKEITHAEWFERGHLPAHPPKISISGEMIEKFEKGEL